MRSQEPRSGGNDDNLVVTEDPSEQALGSSSVPPQGASAFHPPVSSGASHSSQGLFGTAGAVSCSPEIPSGGISKPVALPMPVLAVALSQEEIQHANNTDVAVAVVYVGEA